MNANCSQDLKQLRHDIPLFPRHGFGNILYVKQAGEAAEGHHLSLRRLLVANLLPADNKQKALLLKYKTDYEVKFKEDASTFGGHAYDAVLVLTEALKKAGVADKEKVREAIEGTKNLVGTAGIFNSRRPTTTSYLGCV